MNTRADAAHYRAPRDYADADADADARRADFANEHPAAARDDWVIAALGNPAVLNHADSWQRAAAQQKLAEKLHHEIPAAERADYAAAIADITLQHSANEAAKAAYSHQLMHADSDASFSYADRLEYIREVADYVSPPDPNADPEARQANHQLIANLVHDADREYALVWESDRAAVIAAIRCGANDAPDAGYISPAVSWQRSYAYIIQSEANPEAADFACAMAQLDGHPLDSAIRALDYDPGNKHNRFRDVIAEVVNDPVLQVASRRPEKHISLIAHAARCATGDLYSEHTNAAGLIRQYDYSAALAESLEHSAGFFESYTAPAMPEIWPNQDWNRFNENYSTAFVANLEQQLQEWRAAGQPIDPNSAYSNESEFRPPHYPVDPGNPPWAVHPELLDWAKAIRDDMAESQFRNPDDARHQATVWQLAVSAEAALLRWQEAGAAAFWRQDIHRAVQTDWIVHDYADQFNHDPNLRPGEYVQTYRWDNTFEHQRQEITDLCTALAYAAAPLVQHPEPDSGR